MREHQTITLFDVALRLGLPSDRNSLYVDCPACHGKKKLNLNYGKNVFRCNKCGDRNIHTEGGPLDLYMLFTGITDYRTVYKEFEGDAPAEVANAKLPPAPPQEEAVVAPVAVRDATYRAFLSLCNLHERHWRDLLERGLTRDQIEKNGYRSWPSDLRGIALKLLRMGCTLEGVPGFYKDKKGWTIKSLDWFFGGKPASGILIPQRNSKGQIQGFQIRLDDPDPEAEVIEDRPRYVAMTSRDKEGGAPAYAYVHFRRGARGCSEIILTEGALKADVICALSGYSVLSVPGVNSQKYLPAAFRSLMKRDVQKIRIAYDMDLREKKEVQKAYKKLVSTLDATCTHCGVVVREDKRDRIMNGKCPCCGKPIGMPHSTMRWDPRYKGLDDYLLAVKKGNTVPR